MGKPQKQQPGSPKILTDQMKYFVCVQSLYFPMSDAELANKILLLYGITISDDTVNNCRKSYAFKYGQMVRCLGLQPHHMVNRVSFANWFLGNIFSHRYLHFGMEMWAIQQDNALISLKKQCKSLDNWE